MRAYFALPLVSLLVLIGCSRSLDEPHRVGGLAQSASIAAPAPLFDSTSPARAPHGESFQKEAVARRYLAVRHELHIQTDRQSLESAWRLAGEACEAAGCELLASSIMRHEREGAASEWTPRLWRAFGQKSPEGAQAHCAGDQRPEAQALGHQVRRARRRAVSCQDGRGGHASIHVQDTKSVIRQKQIAVQRFGLPEDTIHLDAVRVRGRAVGKEEMPGMNGDDRSPPADGRDGPARVSKGGRSEMARAVARDEDGAGPDDPIAENAVKRASIRPASMQARRQLLQMGAGPPIGSTLIAEVHYSAAPSDRRGFPRP
jgi:hypothetical protein